MSAQSPPRVLIVGSGPAGLILALNLLKNGIPVRIIEKDTVHHRGERGPGIQPRTLELERFLDNIDEDIAEVGFEAPMMYIHSPEDPTKVMKQLPFREPVAPTPSMPETRTMILGQWRHQAIIRQHLEAYGGRVELGTELIDLDQEVTQVLATLSKTVNGEKTQETASFDYVVGADGAKSFVRHAMGAEFVGETHADSKIFIADAHLGGMPEEKGFYAWGLKGFQSSEGALLRSGNEPGLFQMLFNASHLDLDPLHANPRDMGKIQEIVNSTTGRTDIIVKDVTWQGEWRANLRVASTFRNRRIFIVGDAAHTHSPTGGQGLNTSIQDSINLAWKLQYVLKGFAKESLLDSYTVERVPVISEMLNITTDLYKKAFSGETAREVLGDVQKPGAPGHGGAKAWMGGKKLLQIDINYRWSDIVYDERFAGEEVQKEAYGEYGRAVRAGDRAPDAPGLECLQELDGRKPVSRLFDIFDATHHTALVFANNADTARTLCAHLSAFPEGLLQTALILPSSSSSYDDSSFDFVLRDASGHAFGGYGIDKGHAVVIVRPDSWIGAVATSTAGVKEYISRVFFA